VDLARFLAGAPITSVRASRTGAAGEDPSVSLTMTFANGWLGTVHYLTGGHRGFPKERVEVFAGGRVIALDNFRTLKAYGWSGSGRWRRRRQDKGHRACIGAFLGAARGDAGGTIAMAEIIEVMNALFDASDALRA
jgi:predicted dehydrogenase